MVNPDVRVVGVERYTVVHAAHDTDVAELNAFAVTYQETETFDGSIVADTLKGHVQLRVSLATFHLYALLRAANGIKILLCNETNKAKCDRRLVLSFLITGNNSLQTHAGIASSTSHRRRDGLRRVLGDIKHLCTLLQRAVAVIGTWGIAVLEGKALAAVVHDFQIGSAAGLSSHLCTLSIDGHNLHLVSASLQTHHIGTSVTAVVADQLVVNLGVAVKLSALHIDVIALGTFYQSKLHVGRLQPALSLHNLNSVCTGQQCQTGKQA